MYNMHRVKTLSYNLQMGTYDIIQIIVHLEFKQLYTTIFIGPCTVYDYWSFVLL